MSKREAEKQKYGKPYDIKALVIVFSITAALIILMLAIVLPALNREDKEREAAAGSSSAATSSTSSSTPALSDQNSQIEPTSSEIINIVNPEAVALTAEEANEIWKEVTVTIAEYMSKHDNGKCYYGSGFDTAEERDKVIEGLEKIILDFKNCGYIADYTLDNEQEIVFIKDYTSLSAAFAWHLFAPGEPPIEAPKDKDEPYDLTQKINSTSKK